MQKNVQFIDGAQNDVYDIFSINESGFKEIFSLEGQDIEFSDDWRIRLGDDRMEELLDILNVNPMPRFTANGIHGKIYFDCYGWCPKDLFPTKRESDVRPPITRRAQYDQDTSLKYVQLIDNSRSCTHDICEIEADVFKIVFPAPGQNIEFSRDIRRRLRRSKTNELFRELRGNLVDKKTIPRIDGTLFFKLDVKKKYYPTKKDKELAPFSRDVGTWQKYDELLNDKDGEEKRERNRVISLGRVFGKNYY